MIAPGFIQELLARTDIVQVISSHVSLRKAGQSYKALCPFHEEKTPSFTVNPARQFYHCFGCGVSGTAIDFLMRKTGLSFPDAIEDLAGQAGMTVVYDGKDSRQRRGHFEELEKLLEQACRWYRKQLAAAAGAAARAYLDKRGMNEELCEKYEIGYAPAGWDNLGELGRDEHVRKQMVAAGLLIPNRSGNRPPYDRFRNRILFPIRGYNGRMVGFGGRALSDDDDAKYLNSPESDIFHKGRELYGAHRLRERRGRIERLYVVEGYMDVIALAQYGIQDAVATMGTAIGSWQLRSLFRYSPCVVMCFDGDAAGQRAAKKALDVAMPQLSGGQEIRFLFLPEGDDPDSFVRREGADRFTDSGRDIGLYDFVMQNICTDAGRTNGPEGTARLLDAAGDYVRRLGDPIARELLVKELANRSGLETAFLKETLLKHERKPPPRPADARENASPAADSINPLLTKVIQLLLHRPSLISTVDTGVEDVRQWHIRGADFLAAFLTVLRDNPDITTAALIERWRGSPYEERLRALAADDFMPGDDEGRQVELDAAIRRLGRQSDKRHLRSLLKRSGSSELSSEQISQIRRLQSRIAREMHPDAVTTKS